MSPLVAKLKDRKKQMGSVFSNEEGEQFDKNIKCLGDLPSDFLIDVIAANSDRPIHNLRNPTRVGAS